MLNAKGEWHPEREATSKCGSEETPGVPSASFTGQYGCGCKPLSRLPLQNYSDCSLDGRRKRSRRSNDVLAIVCITPTVLRSMILYGKCIPGRDWVAVIRIIEVTALWIKQYIVYVRWAFGTSSTGRIMIGDRLNEVTVDWGSTVLMLKHVDQQLEDECLKFKTYLHPL